MVIKGLQCGEVLYLECLVTLHHSVQLDRHWHHSCNKLVSFPDPLAHVRERGSGVLSDFSCHSSTIWELKSDCRTHNYMRWCGNRARDLVCMQCMGNVRITFFTPFDPTPCNKKSCSEHQTLHFSGGSGHETSDKSTRPSPSILAYCKRSETGQWEGLGMSLGILFLYLNNKKNMLPWWWLSKFCSVYW